MPAIVHHGDGKTRRKAPRRRQKLGWIGTLKPSMPVEIASSLAFGASDARACWAERILLMRRAGAAGVSD